MSQSITSYFKIIQYAIKNKKFIELLNIKIEHFIDLFKKNRHADYEQISINENNALKFFLPNFNFNLNEVVDLEHHLDKFIEFKKNQKSFSIENPYPINFGLNRNVARLLFFLCKFTKPTYVIETGVANGFSSSYILSALDILDNGELFSFENIFLPWQTKEKIGSAIPENLKKRHHLVIGNSTFELKKLLNKLESIDIFIHDSTHTYNTMMKEFEISWPYIKTGGFLFSDDVHKNNAFLDFAEIIHRKPIIVKWNDDDGFFGLIKK
jgi:predicted O-methyltransferase YrrM